MNVVRFKVYVCLYVFLLVLTAESILMRFYKGFRLTFAIESENELWKWNYMFV